MTTISRLSVSLTADPKGFKKGIKGATTQLGMLKKDVAQIGIGIAALGGLGAGLLLNDIVDVNAKFQTLKSTLTTLTGSQAAGQAAFEQIQNFAKTTPFNLDQVVDSFIKLKGLGLDPSERALTSYGNTASAMGKSLNQMIEAVADASTGEMERLKEFGIRASKQGDEVTFTFQGVETTVKNSSEAIQGYLLGIGENQFGGAMKDQMDNLTPAFSNFQGAVEQLQVAVGEAGLNDMIIAATHSMTAFIESIKPEEVVAAVEEIKGAFQAFSDFIDPITDAIGGATAQNELRDIMEGSIAGPGFVDALSNSSKIAFEKAIKEGGFFDRGVTGEFSDEFKELSKDAELLEESKRQTEELGRIVDNVGVAVAG